MKFNRYYQADFIACDAQRFERLYAGHRDDDDSIITADKIITDCVSDIHCIQIVNPIVAVEGQVRFKLKLPFHVKTKKHTVVQGVVPTPYLSTVYALCVISL